MSSRALRKLQREQELQRQLDAAKKAYEEAEESEEEEESPEPAALPSRPKNAFDMLEEAEDEEESDGMNETSISEPFPNAKSSSQASAQPSSTPSTKSKKKKKKARKKGKAKAEAAKMQEEESGDEVDRALKALAAKDGREHTAAHAATQHAVSWESRATKLLAVDSQNLNPINEMRSLFGNIVLEDQESRASPRHQRRREPNQREGVDLATALTGRYSVGSRGKELGALAHRRNVFVQGHESWPLASSGGLSVEPVKPDAESENSFEKQYDVVYNNVYRETQMQFRHAVESMDPQRMIGLLSMYPYHIATLLQVSEIAKHQGDNSVTGDLLERALYSFGKSVHSTFPAALRTGVARVSFKKAANRELYLAIWRYIRNLEMKGTYRTAFEWAKILLQLNPLTDPYGVTLMIDQLALRGRQHEQLIQLCSNEAYGPAWDFLPNIQISLALAYLRSGKQREARSCLAIAIHKYPYILSALASALDISPLPKSLWAKLPSTDAEKLYTQLYVTRAKDLWNTPETIALLGEVAETLNHYQAAIAAAPEAPNLEISLEEARHIMLLEIPSLIALLPRKFTTMPSTGFDVLPPPDSQSDFVARAPGAGPTRGGDATMQTIFSAAGATAGTAGSLLTRIMNWFQTPATANDVQGESPGQAALRELQDHLGGNIPPEMIEELLRIQIDDAQDLGEGVTAAGLGMAGGWDYYEEADRENATDRDDEEEDYGDDYDDYDSMPELESLPDAPTSHPAQHAARVEDAEDDDSSSADEFTPRHTLPSSGAVLRHVDSDDEETSAAPQAPDTPPPQLIQIPQTSTSSSTAPQTSSSSAAAVDLDFSDPQRLQRWLLTTGLDELKANTNSAAALTTYIDRLKMLGPKQRDWIVRMARQRAGEGLEKKIRDSMGT